MILRIGFYLRGEPDEGTDERERHAIVGPPEWIAERLDEYVDAGCNGFVVNLGHDAPDLDDRIRQFAEHVRPLLAT